MPTGRTRRKTTINTRETFDRGSWAISLPCFRSVRAASAPCRERRPVTVGRDSQAEVRAGVLLAAQHDDRTRTHRVARRLQDGLASRLRMSSGLGRAVSTTRRHSEAWPWTP